jgi:AbiV family abortive infection protein
VALAWTWPFSKTLKMPKLNYRNNLDFIEKAIRASWKNAQELLSGAEILIDKEHHAQALSLSVLALEEVGKLFCIDGLIFSKPKDHKAEAFSKSLKSHETKLLALNLISMLIYNYANCDPRYDSDKAYKKALAIGINNMKNSGNNVLELIDENDFCGLDRMKQAGFYSQLTKKNTFITPSKALGTEEVKIVYDFAELVIGNLNFVLEDGNLERYIDRAKRSRTALSMDDLEIISAQAEELVRELFEFDQSKESDNSILH